MSNKRHLTQKHPPHHTPHTQKSPKGTYPPARNTYRKHTHESFQKRKHPHTEIPTPEKARVRETHTENSHREHDRTQKARPNTESSHKMVCPPPQRPRAVVPKHPPRGGVPFRGPCGGASPFRALPLWGRYLLGCPLLRGCRPCRGIPFGNALFRGGPLQGDLLSIVYFKTVLVLLYATLKPLR